MGLLQLNNLQVRSYVGTDSNMKNNDQKLTINIEIIYFSTIEEESDNYEDSFDITELIKEITGRAENSHFNIIEAFARMVLKTIFEFNRVEKASVEVMNYKKPQVPCDICFSLSDSKK